MVCVCVCVCVRVCVCTTMWLPAHNISLSIYRYLQLGVSVPRVLIILQVTELLFRTFSPIFHISALLFGSETIGICFQSEPLIFYSVQE